MGRPYTEQEAREELDQHRKICADGCSTTWLCERAVRLLLAAAPHMKRYHPRFEPAEKPEEGA